MTMDWATKVRFPAAAVFSFRHHITTTLAPTHSRGQQGYFPRGQTDHTVKAYSPAPSNEIRHSWSCFSIPRKSSWRDELWNTGINFAFLRLIYTNYVPFSKSCQSSPPLIFLSSSSCNFTQVTVAECLHRSLLHGASTVTWVFSRVIS